MNVYNNHGGNKIDPIGNLGFERLAAEGLGNPNVDFYYGGHPNPKIFEQTDRKKVFFTTEEQSWSIDSTDTCIEVVDKILTICPPSITGRSKRESCFFPFDENFIPKEFNKQFDCIYTGAADGPHVEDILSVISKFRYCFASFVPRQHVTHFNVSYIDKLDLISRSKIYPLHNLTGTGTPQSKTRMHEAAIGKALILCKRDEWNLIEEWYEEGKHFLYYKDKEELDKLIKLILINYEKYIPIVEAAYNQAINNYTTRHFIQKYLS